MELSLLQGHEDFIAGKGYNSRNHYYLVHKFILNAASSGNSGCRGSSGKNRKKTRNDLSLGAGKGQEQKKRLF